MKAKKIIYQENGQIKNKIVNEFDVENLPENIIEIKDSFDLSFKLEINKKISEMHMKEILYELDMMLDANILLNDAFDMLIKKEKVKLKKQFLKELKDSLSNSLDVSKLFAKYKINRTVKSFFIILQESGNTKMNISSLYKIIEENLTNKKQFLKALSYPILLLVTLFFALLGIFNFVVPNFESIILNSRSELSFATKSLFSAKLFFDEYLIITSICISLFTFFLIFLHKKSLRVKNFIDNLLVFHIPLISSLYRYKVLYIYFTSIDILLKNGYEFFETLVKARASINNQTVFARITELEDSIKSGKRVSDSFENSKLFDDMIINILASAEVSNSLDKAVYKSKEIYKAKFDDKIKFFILLIEPLFFIIIMTLIVWIIMALFVPLWSMSDLLKI